MNGLPLIKEEPYDTVGLSPFPRASLPELLTFAAKPSNCGSEFEARLELWRRSNDCLRCNSAPEIAVAERILNMRRLASIWTADFDAQTIGAGGTRTGFLGKAELLRELGDFSGAKGLLFRIPKSFVSCFVENLVDAQDTRVRVVGVYPDPVVYQKACEQRTELIRKNRQSLDLWKRRKEKVNTPGKWAMIIAGIAALMSAPMVGLWAVLVGFVVLGVFEMFKTKSNEGRLQAWIKANPRPEEFRFPIPSFDPRLPLQQATRMNESAERAHGTVPEFIADN